MKKLFYVVLFSVSVFANLDFEKNQKCSSCHSQIFEEYQGSQHAKATVFKDPIHGAVYDKHPQKNKLQKYRCAKCHTPTADNMKALLTKYNKTIPDPNNATQNEAVACAYCHRITDTVMGKNMGKNIMSKELKKYFSKSESKTKSPFHKTEVNKAVFKNANLCVGCHTRKANGKQFDVCSTEIDNSNDDTNCMSCHMPQVKGAPSIMSQGKTHSFHGFPGIHGDLKFLSKYVKLDLKKKNKTFSISIDHQATHSSTLHPMRFSKLTVSIKRDGKTIELPSKEMYQIIGSEKGGSPKPTPPWLATKVLKDTRIPANTKKDYSFDYVLKSKDVVTAKFGHYLVNPKTLKAFNLENNEEAKKFRVLSEKEFTIK